MKFLDPRPVKRSGLLPGWTIQIWNDEVIHYYQPGDLAVAIAVAEFPHVEGFFVVGFTPPDNVTDDDTTVVVAGPYPTFPAAAAAYRIMQ